MLWSWRSALCSVSTACVECRQGWGDRWRLLWYSVITSNHVYHVTQHSARLVSKERSKYMYCDCELRKTKISFKLLLVWQSSPGMVGLAPKRVRLDPKVANSGSFSDQISVHLAPCAKCTEIWSEKAPDLSHLGLIWPTLEPNLPPLCQSD